MELWGAYLLLCLFSLLTQVTAEPPSPKVKKAANAKKGKEGDRAPLHLPGSWSPSPSLGPWGSFSFRMSLENASEVPLGPGSALRSRGGCQKELTLTVRKNLPDHQIHFSPPRCFKEIKLCAQPSGDAQSSPERASGSALQAPNLRFLSSKVGTWPLPQGLS